MWHVKLLKHSGAYWFQSTHLIRDVTYLKSMICSTSSISIHTSHTRCDEIVESLGEFISISIHTSHTRCDWSRLRIQLWPSSFQSTHLIRDVTPSRRMGIDSSDYFNPHISYEMWPVPRSHLSGSCHYFNPHISYEMWHGYPIRQDIHIYFNPHISYEMWLSCPNCSTNGKKISIHTSHTRCDDLHLFDAPRSKNFNPHISYEMWPKASCWIAMRILFQSTHLIRDVTAAVPIDGHAIPISIHTSHTRCDAGTAGRVEL